MARLIPWRGTELTPWRRRETALRPLQDFESLFDRWVGEMFRGAGVTPQVSVPPMEIRELKNEYVVSLEVPGLNEKDIDISVSDNALIVRGEKKQETERKEEGLSYSELTYGSFERMVTLPAGAKTDSIGATYKNGVLEIHIAKAPEAQPRHIEVKGESKRS